VLFSKYRAMAPATKGAAWEVPERYSVAELLVALADWMLVPGAHTLTQGP
jgi:hypothetical protein